MPWAKFDDRYPWHRKIRPLSDAAFRLDASAICWCAENLTNGVILRDQLPLVSDVKRPAKAVGELVKNERWHDDQHDCETCPEVPPGGWVIHDYLDYNPTREKVEEEREKRRKSGALGGQASGRARANAKQSASDLLNQTPSKTEAQVASSPTNPRTRTPSPTTTSVEGGSHVSSGLSTAPPRFPDHCAKHAHVAVPGKCGDCKDTREANAWAAEQLPDYRMRVIKPLCGQCDERWIETPTGLAKCPRCYPVEVAS